MPFEIIGLLRQLPLVLTFLVFPVLATFALRYCGTGWRTRFLAFCSLATLPAICILGAMSDVRLKAAKPFIVASMVIVLLYVVTVLISWMLLRRWGRDSSWRYWLAFAFPILVLVLVRFIPGQWHFYFHGPKKHIAEIFVGVSYMAFRLSHLALEYRNRVVEFPKLSEYLAFAFFPPTLSVGPISPYHLFSGSLGDRGKAVANPFQCFLRFIVGLTKYMFLAKLADQLAYQGLLLDSHPHHWIDLPVAALFYYLYLYLNFSGWCDMAIGSAGLAGIRVAENFNHPFLARNIQEFWTRWHMTLTGYMRDVVFTPFSKTLVRTLGPKNAQHGIALSIFCVFMLMGCWHGLASNFLIYYGLQGLGVVAVHYYTIILKKRLGRDGYARYESNRVIQWAGVALTFVFCCVTLFFFANPLVKAAKIMEVFR